MSKDIRSFFKPSAKLKSTIHEKQDNVEIALKSKSETKRNGKQCDRKADKLKKAGNSSKSISSSENKLKSPKSNLKTKTLQKKIEAISSDSDSSDVLCVKENLTRGTELKSKTVIKQKIEVISSDSDSSDLLCVKENLTGGTELKSKTVIEQKVGGNSCSDIYLVSGNKVKSDVSKNTKVMLRMDNDSDDDIDIINPTTDRACLKKRKLQIISSDSEDDDPKRKNIKLNKRTKLHREEQLKPVSISDIFSGMVKQSKIKTTVETPKSAVKRVREKTELGIHEEKDFEKRLVDLDDDIFLQNEDILDRTIEAASYKSSGKKELEKKSSIDEDFKIIKSNVGKILPKENISPTKKVKVLKKGPHEDGIEDKSLNNSKKTKLNHTDSGFHDQDRYEKKKYCAMQYQQYLNRAGPKNHGCKNLPEGKPDCLSNICFLRTGVLDSLESDEFENLIKKHGGKVVRNISRKVNYVVVGEDPGPTKLKKAQDYEIPNISEDELLDMIMVKSGMPKKYTVTRVQSYEDAGINDSFVSNETEKEFEAEIASCKEITIKNIDVKDLDTKNEEKKSSNYIKGDIEVKIKSAEKQEFDSVNSLLSEKYKPKELKQIVGQQLSNSNMNKLKTWLECWHVNDKLRKQKKLVQPKPWDKTNDGSYFKCALLSGPPGVGKTTTATLVAEYLGYDIVEFNASDTRSKKLLQQEVATALSSQNLSSFYINKTGLDNKRVIVMDEVDGMAGNEDRGGMQELISLIKVTKIPIICMCNDRNHQKIRTLANYCFDLRFEKPRAQQILGFVLSICYKEGIQVNPQIVTEIINGTTCDIRQTLNQISMLSNLDTGISLEQAQKDSANAKKDTVLGPWQVCKMVFNEPDQKNMSLLDKSRLFFYDYSMGPLFVQENYLKVQPHVDKRLTMKQVSLAAEAISMGASIDKKIRESNNWSLLDLQAIYSSVLPGHYMSGHFTGSIDFPSWLGKNSKRNKIKRMNNELSMHTRLQTTGGSLAMRLDYSKALLTSIVTPLKKRGLEGVSDAVEVMKAYQLLREDLDSLVELCTGPKQKSLMDGVNNKVKRAFRSLYYKEVPLFSYSANTGLSKKKVSTLYDEDEFNEDEVEETSDTEDTIENDNLIKRKSKSKSKMQNKKESGKANTSNTSKLTKAKTSSKGKGKK